MTKDVALINPGVLKKGCFGFCSFPYLTLSNSIKAKAHTDNFHLFQLTSSRIQLADQIFLTVAKSGILEHIRDPVNPFGSVIGYFIIQSLLPIGMLKK